MQRERSFMQWVEPKLPFRNLDEFRVRSISPLAAGLVRNDPDFWPCLNCGGAGRHFDPGEAGAPLPANYSHTCTLCHGTGHGNKAACQVAYFAAILTWLKEVKAYQAALEVRRQALSKLTEYEIRTLRLLGI